MQFLFGDYSLDIGRRELRRGAALVELEPQVFDLLVYPVQNRDRVVTKEDLIAAILGRPHRVGVHPEQPHHRRPKAIGDSGEQQALIRTAARKGIRFVGAVSARAQSRRRCTGRSDDLRRAEPAKAGNRLLYDRRRRSRRLRAGRTGPAAGQGGELAESPGV